MIISILVILATACAFATTYREQKNALKTYRSALAWEQTVKTYVETRRAPLSIEEWPEDLVAYEVAAVHNSINAGKVFDLTRLLMWIFLAFGLLGLALINLI